MKYILAIAFLACSSVASAQCANGQCGLPSNGFRAFRYSRPVFSQPIYMPRQQTYYTSSPEVVQYVPQPVQVVSRPAWRPRRVRGW